MKRRSFIALNLLAAGVFAAFGASAQSVGVSADSIKIGSVLDLSGINKSTGTAMNEGARAYIEKINASGGVAGRKIDLVVIDDQYDAQKTADAAKKLIEQDKVFALTNFLGTSNAKAALPIVSRENVPLVGARTGGEFLRNPLKRPVFNVRSSYYKEIDALVARLIEGGSKNIALIYPNDAAGENGKTGLERSLARRGMKVAAYGVIEKTTPDKVDDAFAAVKAAKPDAVILTTIASVTTPIVKKAHAEKLGAQLAGFSSVGVAFIKDLKPEESEGVLLSKVFPDPQVSNLPIMAQFKADMAKAGFKSINSTAFEGYMNALMLVEGLKGAGSAPSREGLIKALESFKKDVGGLNLHYTADDHEAMHEVFLSKVHDGKEVYISGK